MKITKKIYFSLMGDYRRCINMRRRELTQKISTYLLDIIRISIDIKIEALAPTTKEVSRRPRAMTAERSYLSK